MLNLIWFWYFLEGIYWIGIWSYYKVWIKVLFVLLIIIRGEKCIDGEYDIYNKYEFLCKFGK